MSFLRLRIDDSESQTSTLHIFQKSPTRIGRSPLNELQLDHGVISQMHAIVAFDETTIRYKDVGSTNGTLRNNEPLPPSEWIVIEPKTPLTIGPLSFYFDRTQTVPQLDTKNPARTFAQKLEEKPANKSVNAARTQHWSGPVPPSALLSPSPSASDFAQTIATPHTTDGPPLLTGEASLEQPPALTPDMRARAQSIAGLYAKYREGWNTLQKELRSIQAQLPKEQHAEFFQAVDQMYPELAQERGFVEQATQAGAELTSSGSMGGLAALRLTQAMEYLGVEKATTFPELETQLLSLVRISVAFADAYVAGRTMCEAFRPSESRTSHLMMNTTLTNATDGRLAVRALMASHFTVDDRVDQIRAAFADVMLQWINLFGIAFRGARALTSKLSPYTVDSELSKSGWLRQIRLFRDAALWRKFKDKYKSTVQEPALTNTILGPHIAQAYAQFSGKPT